MTPQRTGAGTVVGSLRAVDGKAVVRMEDAFGSDAEDLWSAVTDPRRLARFACGRRTTRGAGRAWPGTRIKGGGEAEGVAGGHSRPGPCAPGAARNPRAPLFRRRRDEPSA